MKAQAIERTPAEAALTRQFEAADGVGVSPRRAKAFSRFAERGLPTRRIESWHYTDLRSIVKDASPVASTPNPALIDSARALLTGCKPVGAGRLVLLNGRLVPELCESLPADAVFERRELPSAGVNDAIVDLNEAMSVDAGILKVADGAAIAEPIEIMHVALADQPSAIYSRLAVRVGQGAQVSIVETFLGANPKVQRNASLSLVVADKAKVRLVSAIDDGADLHIESQMARLGSDAELNAFALVAGGNVSRRQLFIALEGENARLTLGGLTLLEGARRADTTLQVNHKARSGASREYYGAIVADEGAGVFQGKIVVEKEAQKTDGSMKSQAVLLSPRAQMSAKPELEIFADDVACGHGATIGSLDPEQLFYLLARGIGKDEAESMLLEGFGRQAIDRIEDGRLGEWLQAPFRRWLVSGRRRLPTGEARALS